ncbi:MAG TPA: hypothetical protein VMW78_03270 [Anaerolineae bacterium]|nr:hypothetical protein [Anaerolineae bacterium]
MLLVRDLRFDPTSYGVSRCCGSKGGPCSKSVADGLIVIDTHARIVLIEMAAEDLLGVYFSDVIDRLINVAIKHETLVMLT